MKIKYITEVVQDEKTVTVQGWVTHGLFGLFMSKYSASQDTGSPGFSLQS